MLFRELNGGRCKAYLIACENSRRAALVDPLRENVARYLAVLAYYRYSLDMVIDTHTHADHQSGAAELHRLTDAPVVMEWHAPSPQVGWHVKDGDILSIGRIKARVIYTPGHTPDALSLQIGKHLLTGDTLLIGGTGRADFAGGDPGAQYDSIVDKLFKLPDDTLVYPAHDYHGRTHSTIRGEKMANPRVAGRSREAYIDLMNALNLPLPDSIDSALQPNQTGIYEGAADLPSYARSLQIKQIAPAETHALLNRAGDPALVLDVREEDETRGDLGRIEGSVLIPLRQLSARASELEPYKDREIIVVCRAGMRSALAAAILADRGFARLWNLHGGMVAWREAELPVLRTSDFPHTQARSKKEGYPAGAKDRRFPHSPHN